MIVQAAYAGDLLYILSLTFSKISLLILLQLITPVKVQVHFILASEAAFLVWGLSALVAVAFQCQVPRVWATMSNQCFHTVSRTPDSCNMFYNLTSIQVAFWNYFGVTNIITEGILLLGPIVIIWNLQMPLVRKLVIFWCFAVRIW